MMGDRSVCVRYETLATWERKGARRRAYFLYQDEYREILSCGLVPGATTKRKRRITVSGIGYPIDVGIGKTIAIEREWEPGLEEWMIEPYQVTYEECTQHLEVTYEECTQRLQARRADLEPIAKRLAVLPGELVDASTKARADLIEELQRLEQERRVLLIEIGELQRRERDAYIAIFEAQEAEAREAYQQANARRVELHRAANALSETLRSALNHGIPEEIKGDQNAIDLYLADLKAKHTRAWALSGNASRDAREAGAALEAAQKRLQEVIGSVA